MRYDSNLRTLRDIDVLNVLKMMNTRIRYPKMSSHEMLFKREMMNNKDIVVKDKDLADKRQTNRAKSSEYNEKYKMKSSKVVEDQELEIGEFVFIRGQLNKHKARDLYVIHDVETCNGVKNFLIRKAEGKFRTKLYRMLQEELVRAPILNEVPNGLDEGEDEEVSELVNNGVEVIGTDERYLDNVTNDSRPKRKAAEKAKDMFKKTLYVQDDLGRVFKLNEMWAPGTNESFERSMAGVKVDGSSNCELENRVSLRQTTSKGLRASQGSGRSSNSGKIINCEKADSNSIYFHGTGLASVGGSSTQADDGNLESRYGRFKRRKKFRKGQSEDSTGGGSWVSYPMKREMKMRLKREDLANGIPKIVYPVKYNIPTREVNPCLNNPYGDDVFAADYESPLFYEETQGVVENGQGYGNAQDGDVEIENFVLEESVVDTESTDEDITVGENGGENREEVFNETINEDNLDENIVEGSMEVGKEDGQGFENLLEGENGTLVIGEEKDYKRKRLITHPIERGIALSLPRRTRSKTEKAAPYDNYAELHTGRKKSRRPGDRVQAAYGEFGSGRPI